MVRKGSGKKRRERGGKRIRSDEEAGRSHRNLERFHERGEQCGDDLIVGNADEKKEKEVGDDAVVHSGILKSS